jgi:hypothetical protein
VYILPQASMAAVDMPSANKHAPPELPLALSDILTNSDVDVSVKSTVKKHMTIASLQTCADDPLAIIASCMSSSRDQASLIQTCRAIHTGLKTRMIWAYFQTHNADAARRPVFGRIRIVQLIGDAARLPTDAVTGQPLRVYELRIQLGKQANFSIPLWPQGLKVLTVEKQTIMSPFRFRHGMPEPVWPTYNKMAPAGLHTLKVYDCPLYNQPAPAGLHTIKIFNCRIYDQAHPAGVHEIIISDCPHYNQPAPEGTLSFEIYDCATYNSSIPESLQKCTIINCANFSQPIPTRIPTYRVSRCPRYTGL